MSNGSRLSILPACTLSFFFPPFPSLSLPLSPFPSLSYLAALEILYCEGQVWAPSPEKDERIAFHYTVTRGTHTLGRAGKGGSTQVVCTAKHVVPPRPDAPRKYFLSPAIYDSMIPRSSRKRRVISLLSRTDKQPARCNSYNTIVRVDDQVSLPGRSWMVEEAVLRRCTRVCV